MPKPEDIINNNSAGDTTAKLIADLTANVNSAVDSMQGKADLLGESNTRLAGHERVLATTDSYGHFKPGKGFEYNKVTGQHNVTGTAAFELDLSEHASKLASGEEAGHVLPDGQSLEVAEDGKMRVKDGATVQREADGTIMGSITGNASTAGLALRAESAATADNVPVVVQRVSALEVDSAAVTRRVQNLEADNISASYDKAGHVLPDGDSVKINAQGKLYAQKAAFFPAGTRMIFQQSAAPTGWVKELNSAYTDCGLRLTTGAVGSGGGTAFSAAMNSAHATSSVYTGGTADSTTLSINQMPLHQHPLTKASAGWFGIYGESEGYPEFYIGSRDGITKAAGASYSHSHSISGSSHSHTVNVNLKYIDMIICTKE